MFTICRETGGQLQTRHLLFKISAMKILVFFFELLQLFLLPSPKVHINLACRFFATAIPYSETSLDE